MSRDAASLGGEALEWLGEASRDQRCERAGPHAVDERRTELLVSEDRGELRQAADARQRRDLFRERFRRETEPRRDPEAEAREAIERGRLAADPSHIRAATVEPFDQSARRLSGNRHPGSLARRRPALASRTTQPGTATRMTQGDEMRTFCQRSVAHILGVTPGGSPEDMDRQPSRARLIIAAILLGVGLGGFFDGIVLHQILQWHHMISTPMPPDTV